MKKINGTNCYITKDGRVINEEGHVKSTRLKNGYEQVELYFKELRKANHYGVHRIVATYYISNPEMKPEVHHKDFNKLNNHVDNLQWVTRKENVNYNKFKK